MFAIPPLMLCGSVPAYRSPIAFRSAPFRPRRRRTLFARVSCVRARARPRAHLAPARFAHLIARARRRTHFSCPFPPGLFSGPSPCFPLQKSEKAAPGSRLSTLIIHHFLSSQAPWWEKCEFFLLLPEDGRTPPFVMPGLDSGESRGPALVFGAASTARRQRVRRRWRSRLRCCRR